MDSQITLVITTISTVTGTVLVAYLAYKTARIGKTIEAVKTQTDGITSALVSTTAKASHAEGKLQGAAEQKADKQA